MKTPQKLQGSFSVKLLKIRHKNRREVLASGLNLSEFEQID